MAVALPALLAACTAEEVVEQAPVANLSGRAVLDPNFAVNVAEGAQSRFAWENTVWSWEEGDKFGAAVVDPATLNSISSTSMLGNYIFAKNEAGDWKTTSQMSEGTYLYYSFDGFENKSSRSLLAFDFRNQKANLNDADAELNKYENQLFISPLYKLVSEYSSEKLPLTFYSFAGVGAFPMTNNSGQDLKITQIILRGNDGAATPANMFVKGYVNPNALSAAKYEFYADSAKYIPSAAAALLKSAKKAGETADAEDVAACYTAAKNAILNNQAAVKGDDGVQSEYITLDCQNYLLKDGKSVTAYMMIPAGMTNMSVEIMVVDEEGEAWSVYANQAGELPTGVDSDGGELDAIEVNNMSEIKTKRDKTNAIFGKTTDNKSMKSIKIKAENLCENSGYYVDSKEALIELLDGNLGTIKVHNSGDWAIDKEVVDAILNYSGAGIQFTNPIEIKSTTALTAEKDLALSKVAFTDVTVVGTKYAEDGETVIFEGTTAELNVTVNGTLTVEAGANVTIIGGSYEKIVNNGTLSVKPSVTKANIETNGTLNLYNDKWNVTLKKGALNYMGHDKDADGTVEDDEEYTAKLPTIAATDTYSITYAEHVNLKVDAAAPISPATNKTATLTVNGGFELNAKMTVNKGVTLTVADDITGTGSIEINGAATNRGESAVKFSVAKGATLTNNGEVEISENEGTVTTGEGSKTVINGKKGEGRVNNTVGAQVTNNAGEIVYYLAENKAIEDLESILFKRYAINTLRVKGTLTIDRAFDDEKNYEQLQSLKNLELENGAEVKVDGNVVVDIEKVYVLGNATISGWSKDESTLTFADGDAEVNLTYEVVENSSTDVEGYDLKFKNVKVVGIKTYSITKPAGADASKTYRWNLTTITNKDAAIDLIEGDVAQVASVAGLTAAINNAEVENIVLTDDLALSGALDLTSVEGRSAEETKKTALTIDLNGYTLKVGERGTIKSGVISNINLTIRNGSIHSAENAVYAEGGTLNLIDCDVITEGNTKANAVTVNGNVVAVIRGGSYMSNGELAPGLTEDWYGIGVENGDVTLNTTVGGNFGGGVAIAKPTGSNTKVTIEGGSYTGSKYYGLILNGGALTLSVNAKFKGKKADICLYTLTGTVNGVNLNTWNTPTMYTMVDLLEAIKENKQSEEKTESGK